jgi:hypothetical protein
MKSQLKHLAALFLLLFAAFGFGQDWALLGL